MTAAKKLLCGHLFHVHCLRSWLERQHTCPTCRALVVPPEIGTSTQADGHQQGEQLLYFQYSCFLPFIFIYISGMQKKKKNYFLTQKLSYISHIISTFFWLWGCVHLSFCPQMNKKRNDETYMTHFVLSFMETG